MAQDARVFIYNDQGKVIADGHYFGTIDELVNKTDFITVTKDGTADETVNVPVNAVGSIRVYQTVLAYMQSLKLANDTLLEDSRRAIMSKVNVNFANGAGMPLDLVFDVRLINGWTSMTCYDVSDIIFTHLMPPKSISNFETSYYEDKNECPIAEKMIWLLDKDLIEKFIEKYETNEKKDTFSNEFKEWLIGIGIKPIEFVFGLSSSIYVIDESKDRDEYIKDINKLCESIIEDNTETVEKKEQEYPIEVDKVNKNFKPDCEVESSESDDNAVEE